MSFHPLKGGFDQSLLGVGANSEIIGSTKLVNRAHYLAKPGEGFNFSRTVIIIIVSAVIFVTVVSFYDVIRNIISNHYAKIALTDPKAQNTSQQISSTLVANQQGLTSSIMFCLFCIAVASIVIFIIYQRYKNGFLK